eukprot:TRINITY_DN2415_c0_g1_i1.p1 TRINITY_DN2415_c0_g1~~TRINITY_DN2415_c0_g1_i1.p1  ORF type:complete len:261 (+),score=40.57 TRINITY_DN2415_c0_g1_i1:51-833(+)
MYFSYSRLIIFATLFWAACGLKLSAVSYYWPCDLTNTTCGWEELIALQNNTGVLGFAMVNPNSGPGPSEIPEFEQLVEICNDDAVPLPLFGYSHTSEGNRGISIIKGEIAAYFSFYPQLNGIFLDEGSNDCNEFDYYHELYTYIKSLKPDATVVINPGTNVPECYSNCSDILVTFESPLSVYKDYVMSPWNLNYPTTRFWHIVYDVYEDELASTLKKMVSNHAGYVYVSDLSGDNPYNANPSYLTEEAKLVMQLDAEMQS